MNSRTHRILTSAVVFITAVLLFTSGMELSRVKGPSMNPNLREGRIILVCRWAYGWPRMGKPGYLFFWKRPQKEDVIVFELPDTGVSVVKRVTAVAGDPMIQERGWIHFSTETLALKKAHRPQFKECRVVPEESLFVTGDNSDRSLDSRHYGFVNQNQIRGKVIYPPL